MGYHFLATKNNMGYASDYIDETTKHYIDYCNSNKNLKVLELAACYGFISKLTVSSNNSFIINDLTVSNLREFMNYSSQKNLENIEFQIGKFPYELTITKESLDVVFIPRMLHILTPESFRNGIKKLYYWLKPGGTIYAIVDTPFLGFLKEFQPIYNRRLEKKSLWPGMVENLWSYAPDRKHEIPLNVNFLDKGTMFREFSELFSVKFIKYIERPDFPLDLQYDGRETVGIIAKKIC